jgi:hypothetical protein
MFSREWPIQPSRPMVATRNYVDTTTAAFLSTGDVKLTLKTAAAEHVPQRNG